jgi:cytochrome c biogenesis protein CcmG, thiol:disulfide interchange protein DsbE
VRRSAVPIAAAVAAAALVALLAYGVLSSGDDTTLDSALARGDRPAAPSLALPLLGDEGTRGLADLEGQVVVLNFWASWCEPCKAEAPVLERAHKRLTDEEAGTVLGVTFRDSSPASLRFVRDFGLSYPSVRDVEGDLARAYGTRALPETFVIDRDGKVAAIERGQLDQARMDRALDTALAG